MLDPPESYSHVSVPRNEEQPGPRQGDLWTGRSIGPGRDVSQDFGD